MNELIGNLTDASPPVLLAGVLYLLGMYLSRSPLPGWAVPLVLGTLGAVLYPWIADGAKVSYQVRSPLVFNGVMGLLLGLSPTGLHQFFKQTASAGQSGTSAGAGDPPSGKVPVWVILGLAGTLALPTLGLLGCATTGDGVVVNVERVERVALPTFQKFLHWERLNQAMAGPDVHAAAEELRKHGLDYLADLEAVKEAYKANRTAENKAGLEAALAAVTAALDRTEIELGKAGVK